MREGFYWDNVLFAVAVLLLLLCSGCGHNVSQMEFGRLLSVGSPEYGKVKYMDGFAITEVGKENTRIKVEVDSTTGITIDPVSGNLKGITSVEIESGPQLTGYIKEASSETAAAYFDAVKSYYNSRHAPTASVSTEKSTAATTSAGETVVKSIMSRLTGKDTDDTAGCTSFDGMSNYATVSYHKETAALLLSYADDVNQNSSGVKLKVQLEEFINVMNQFEAADKETTNLRLKRAKVCDGLLTFLEIVSLENGQEVDVPCVGCKLWTD